MRITPSGSDDENHALLRIEHLGIVPVIVMDDHTRAGDLADALVAGPSRKSPCARKWAWKPSAEWLGAAPC